MPETFTFGRAECEADRRAVFLLRERNYRDSADYLLDTKARALPGEDEFDSVSDLFFLKVDNRVVASCRLTPHNDGRWAFPGTVEADLPAFDPVHWAHFNRVVVDRAWRNRKIHDHLFLEISAWGLTHTRLRHYFSICRVSFFRFYQIYGARKVIETPLAWANRDGLCYFLIRGDFEDTYQLMCRRLGRDQAVVQPG